jgi:uncharacterized membrane protein YcfT
MLSDINFFGFFVFLLMAVYQSAFKHNEAEFIHWMLWAIVCGISYLINERLNDETKGRK